MHSIYRRGLALTMLAVSLMALGSHAGSRSDNHGLDAEHRMSGPPAPGTRKVLLRLLPSPNDYLVMARADIQLSLAQGTLSPLDLPYTRYLVTHDFGDPGDDGLPPLTDRVGARLCSLTMQYISRGPSNGYNPVPVAGGRLVRVDLRGGIYNLYTPRAADLKDWLNLWELLAFDPMFNLDITRDTVDLLGKGVTLPTRRVKVTRVKNLSGGKQRTETRTIEHPGGRYVYPDDSGRVHQNLAAGRWTVDLVFNEGKDSTKQIIETVFEEVVGFRDGEDTIHVPAQSLDPILMSQLQDTLCTEAPVVDGRYFRARALHTIKDKGSYKDIWGGLYYDFVGIKLAKDVLGKDTKATDLDLYFESLGIGNIKTGLTQEQLFDGLRSDQRIALNHSLVTSRPREVSMFHTPADQEGASWGAITGDVQRQSIGPAQRAMSNLLKPFRENREAIFPKVNTFPLLGLFNGEGARADSVPSNVAPDTTMPGEWSKDLEAAIGCIRCHGTDGSDGWKPLTNDVKRLFDSNTLFTLTDLSGGRHHYFGMTEDEIIRIRGLYRGDFSLNLSRARDDLARVTLQATGLWPESEKNQADVCRIAANHLAEDARDYLYTLVDAKIALRDFGLDVPADKAVSVFKRLLIPDNRSDVGGGVALESVTIDSLRIGMSVNREDWSLVQPFATERALRVFRTIKKEELQKWLEQ